MFYLWATESLSVLGLGPFNEKNSLLKIAFPPKKCKKFKTHKSSLSFFNLCISVIYYHRQCILHRYPKPTSKASSYFIPTLTIISYKVPSAMATLNKASSVPRIHDNDISQDVISDQKLRGSGAIHVITGPMFSGKSTSLLRRIKSEISLGR